MTDRPTVTIGIPVLNEEAHLRATLDSIRAQTYPGITQVLIADGGSTDATRAIVEADPLAELVDNPGRIQSCGLNEMLERATGEVFVRVDGHCELAPDYVERCCAALDESGAAMVGGAMNPVTEGRQGQAAIARAMASRVGAGPARFHVGGLAAWVDTVYLGAYRTADAVAVGGYATDVGVNEDSEFAIRLGAKGGVWFDPSIRSSYVPRASLRRVARQFFRYGRSRAATVRRHPGSLRPRQLAAPLLLVGLASPWRRKVLAAYTAVVVADAVTQRRHLDPVGEASYIAVLPTMHLCWGAGFWLGLVRPPPAGEGGHGR